MYSVIIQPKASDGTPLSHKNNKLISLDNNAVLYYYYNYRSILFL
jgi:hypothetical protein